MMFFAASTQPSVSIRSTCLRSRSNKEASLKDWITSSPGSRRPKRPTTRTSDANLPTPTSIWINFPLNNAPRWRVQHPIPRLEKRWRRFQTASRRRRNHRRWRSHCFSSSLPRVPALPCIRKEQEPCCKVWNASIRTSSATIRRNMGLLPRINMKSSVRALTRTSSFESPLSLLLYSMHLLLYIDDSYV